jgi:asparagine synthase (glutamine-hydrolysing)
MPGIAGMISQRPADKCLSHVKAMVGSMEHERFYTSGIHSVPEMGVYSGWVALEGAFAAGQVFLNEQHDVALIFSGECFVDRELPACLREKGHTLGKNKGDWLVHLYEEEGDRFFEQLNGLFSGLLLDKRQGKAFLFNDRYSMERIYWHETNDALYFASEAKALLRVLPELRAFDDEGVAQFLTYGCTFETRTLFRGISLLPGGSLWSFEAGNCCKQKYFSPETWEAQSTLSVEHFQSAFEDTFKRILPRYFESEARIGISLTAGVDTRMIMACRPQTAMKPTCYTFSGKKGITFDDRFAARVADCCGLDHRLLRIGSDFFSDFATHADRTVYITDGCFGVTGAHEIYLNRLARQLAPVRLTGNYGSEVLRGVSTFKPIGLSPELFDQTFRCTLNAVGSSLLNGNTHPVTFAAFREIPSNLFGSLAAARSQTLFRTPYLDNEIVALAYRSPESLRTSPRLAFHVVKTGNAALARIPTDMGLGGNDFRLIAALTQCFAKATFKLDYLNNDGLPHWLSPFDPLLRRLGAATGALGLHKYLHYRGWFIRELAGYLHAVLTDVRTRQSSVWNSAFLQQMFAEHARCRKNYVLEINAVLTLEAVERLLLQGHPGRRAASDEM